MPWIGKSTSALSRFNIGTLKWQPLNLLYMTQAIVHTFRGSPHHGALYNIMVWPILIIKAISIICFLKFYAFCILYLINASVRNRYLSRWQVPWGGMVNLWGCIVLPLERRDICTESACGRGGGGGGGGGGAGCEVGYYASGSQNSPNIKTKKNLLW